jgi:hypothetical protein
MSSKSEPVYIHLILYAVIAVLVVVLIKVAFIDPNEVIQQEKYFKAESRLRMSNLREAERLYQVKYKKFTDNIDSLILFLKNDPSVQKAITGTDSITGRPTNPFDTLTDGTLTWDSLYHSQKSLARYIIQVDSSEISDTIVDRRGKILKVDTQRTIGQRYYIECPDGYGSIGDVSNDALKNTASWE